MTLHIKDDIDKATAKCANPECGYEGTLAQVEVHSCYVQEMGGRCEDYPACGHTDGDGCQTLPQHTSDFYYRNPQFLHEPGSPEWYDELDNQRYDEED